MPYIGQRPATGEANSFKILDEISSYTLTFDGSSAAVVSLSNDTITAREHRFVTGQRVTYNDGGGTAITGLSDGVYYIIVEDRHTFKLASSANNAASGTAINLTGLGVGASHTLNVAFDGVNTKFKATINNGDKAGITASGQLMLSINGVLQEPHDNTTSPTTGYSTDPTSTIIFSAAPAATDQFFGRLIASNFATFDISDNVVDNFTGDGSTTSFSLSKSPANNENVLVTIDGVVQYPDDKDAVRAYSVSENILSFVSAPGNGVEIQVRHIGFAGATSGGGGGVTGFYGRTGNAVLKSTDDIVFNDATASGDIQAANVTVTGNLTVEGTTTTLDTELTSVDKLEVAANNTTVAAAITQTGSGDILNLFDGSTEVFTVLDTGEVGIGTHTPGASLQINSATPKIILQDNDNGSDISVASIGGAAVYSAASDIIFQTVNTSEKVRITSVGDFGIGEASPNARLHVKDNSSDTDFTDETTPSTKSGITLSNLQGGAGTFTALTFSVSSGSATQNANVIAKATGSGTAPEIHFATRNNSTTLSRMMINSAGNVGIGTATPTGKLEVAHDSQTDLLKLKRTSGNTGTFTVSLGGATPGTIFSTSGVCDDFVFVTGSERLRITSAGKIGIGTDNPSNFLHVKNYTNASNYITAENTTAGNAGVRLKNSQGDYAIFANDDLIFYDLENDVERLSITSGGDLQVGNITNLVASGAGKLNILADNTTNLGIATDGAINISCVSGSGVGRVQSINWVPGFNVTLPTASIGYVCTDAGAYGKGDIFFATRGATTNTAATERLRITSDGRIAVNFTNPDAFNVGAKLIVKQTGADIANGTADHNNGGGSSNTRGIHLYQDSNDDKSIGLWFTTGGHLSGITGQRSNYGSHWGTDLRFYTHTANTSNVTQSFERLRITDNGKLEAYKGTAATGKTSGSEAFTVGNGASNHRFAVYPDGTTVIGGTGDIGNNNIQLRNDGMILAGAAHFTKNLTPTSGRGVEIFEAGTGVGQISSYNRDSSGWDELRIKGSEVKIYTGTSNALGLNLAALQSTLYGTSDGVLNLDTTDNRGAFLRFKENGTAKGWAGCSEGIGTGGDQDDFGIRAVGGFRVRTGNGNRIEVSEDGQIYLNPSTGGFTTSGAAGTIPGAAVAINVAGVGPGTGTNIPQYGLYVNAAGSSNDATLMTGIYAIAKQNVENSAIGIHGLYQTDWSSYQRKIGGLFQAPARATRYCNLSFNPGGGHFANTSDTGHANKLASGANTPGGAADGGATYGDCTGLWGDVFRSDTDTSSEHLRSIAIKATNRSTHAKQRVGLMVGIVDGNDSTENRKKTNFVEYYANSTFQRYYAKNHRKEINQHYPIPTDASSGQKSELLATHNAVYYYQHRPIYNTNSYYFFNTIGSSSARGGRLKVDITWSTGHASGSGEGSYCILYISKHSDNKVGVQRFTKFHQYYTGGSYYGWSSNPELLVYESTSTGNNAGIYLRVKGHMAANSQTYDGYVIQSIKIEATEGNYNFTTEPSFRFVGHSTPSDLGGIVNAQNPNT